MNTSPANGNRCSLAIAVASLLGLALVAPAEAGNFIYDGRLDEFGQPANGRFDIQVSVFGAESHGPRLAEPISFENVEVKDGRFRVEFELPLLDAERAWLAVGVRGGAETTAFAAIPGRSKAAAVAAISTCWSSTGDLGSDPINNFIGTRDAEPLVVRSNNQLSAVFSDSSNAMFGDPVAHVELTLRGAGGAGAYSNLFLEANDPDERAGILLSAGNGTTLDNNHGFYIDQYRASGGQVRRFTIEPNGLVTMDGPGLSLIGPQASFGSNGLSFGSSLRQMIHLWGPNLYGIGVQASTQYFRVDGGANFAWFSGGTHNDALGNPGAGGTRPMFLNANGQLELQNSGTQSPRLRLSFGTTGLLANRYWDFIASRTQLSPGGPVIPAGSLIIADDVGLKAAFDINGLARNQTGTWTSWSDRRLKTAIREIEAPLDTLLKMRGQWFEYRDASAVMSRPGPRMGLIAQDVQKAVPEWVSADERGYLSITPTGFEALTVEALRELRSEGATLDALQAEEIQQLKSENQALRQRLERIEAELAQR